MAVRPKDRFEVFKRDGFTCMYCGRKVPDVVLEVDHIVPRAKGGGDEVDNLITSCLDCNRGKGDRLLDERAPVQDLEERAELIRERERQLLAYNEAKSAEIARRDADFERVWNYWFDLWGRDTLNKWETPWKGPLRNAIERLGIAEVMEAMDVAHDKFTHPSSGAARYFGGVIQWKLARRDGRVVPCTICGKDLMLERGDDPTSSWHHNGCADG
jgi:hypothetical protein